MPERPAQSVEVPLEPTAAVSWLERATEHVGVRAVYLSLAGHLVLAIMLTLWATRLPEPPQRLAPLVLDFGPVDADDIGETQGEDAQATVIAAAERKEEAAEAPTDDIAKAPPPAENSEAKAADSPAEPPRLPPAVQPAAMKVAGIQPSSIADPQPATDPGLAATAAAGAGRATAADARQAIGKRAATGRSSLA